MSLFDDKYLISSFYLIKHFELPRIWMFPCRQTKFLVFLSLRSSFHERSRRSVAAKLILFAHFKNRLEHVELLVKWVWSCLFFSSSTGMWPVPQTIFRTSLIRWNVLSRCLLTAPWDSPLVNLFAILGVLSQSAGEVTLSQSLYSCFFD